MAAIPVDQLRGWTELIKSKSMWTKAFDQLCPSPRLIYGRQICLKINVSNSIITFYAKLYQIVIECHSSFINIYYMFIFPNEIRGWNIGSAFVQSPVYDRIQWTGRTLVFFKAQDQLLAFYIVVCDNYTSVIITFHVWECEILMPGHIFQVHFMWIIIHKSK